jgi:hypothetical protein
MKVITVSSVLKNTDYWSKKAGVRWQLILGLIALWLASYWLRNEYGNDDSNLWLVMSQFIRLLQWTIVILFVTSIVTALVTWSYFYYQVSRKKISVQLKIGDGERAEAGWVGLSVGITGSVFRPLLGTIQASIVFSGKRVSNMVILDSNLRKPKQVLRYGIYGSGETLLHDRGIYDVERILISFCDMLGLVSLPVSIPFNKQLYTLPRAQDKTSAKAQPNAVEEQKHRIEIPRRVEGEYVNYKEFETGDNIRRIVWKIYAKSGQLVVRIPETKDPYASHLYFYASYFNGMSVGSGAFETELLNVYKDKIRNLFEALQRNGYDVRMPNDQEIPKLPGTDEKKNSLFQITSANWQHQNPPIAFVNINKAAFVCISALVPSQEVQALVKNLHPSIPFVVVKLSDAIPSPFQISLKDIFFKPEKKPSDTLRQPWMLSSLRKELIRNEEELQAILYSRENSWMVSTIETENDPRA